MRWIAACGLRGKKGERGVSSGQGWSLRRPSGFTPACLWGVRTQPQSAEAKHLKISRGRRKEGERRIVTARTRLIVINLGSPYYAHLIITTCYVFADMGPGSLQEKRTRPADLLDLNWNSVPIRFYSSIGLQLLVCFPLRPTLCPWPTRHWPAGDVRCVTDQCHPTHAHVTPFAMLNA
jgi:hypothetical protein